MVALLFSSESEYFFPPVSMTAYLVTAVDRRACNIRSLLECQRTGKECGFDMVLIECFQDPPDAVARRSLSEIKSLIRSIGESEQQAVLRPTDLCPFDGTRVAPDRSVGCLSDATEAGAQIRS